jgi:pimeloyl-ACP methyl ester carboxylesterase
MPLLRTADAEISYAKAGSGPPVLLIQGVGVVGEGWRPQIDPLADSFHLVWFDNRGIGGSTLDGGALTIETMAADALAVMAAEGFDRFHVAGHSMGGVIAQELALREPERVMSLSLLCTFERGKDAVRLTTGMVWSGIRSRVGTRAMRRDAFLELVVPASFLSGRDRVALAEEYAALFGHDLADQPSISMRQLKALARYDATDRLAGLSGIPTLVVSASEDRIAWPASGRALAAAIPGARHVEIEGAGHAVPITHADEVNGLLSRHLDGARSLDV